MKKKIGVANNFKLEKGKIYFEASFVNKKVQKKIEKAMKERDTIISVGYKIKKNV